MSNITIRIEQEADLSEVARIRKIAWGVMPDGETERPGVRWQDGAVTLVAEVDGALAGVLTLLPRNANIHGVAAPSAGIAGVAVLPEHRGAGVAATLMNASVEHAHKMGAAFCSLHAFREIYYRKFGWITCGQHVRISCPVTRLPSIRSSLDIRQLEPDDAIPLLKPVHARMVANYNGMNDRADESWWRNRLDKHLTYAAFDGDQARAYIMLRTLGRQWGDQPITEFAWADRAGYDVMLGFFRVLVPHQEAISWQEPYDGPFANHHMDKHVQLELKGSPMFRIVDLPRAFAALRPTGEGELTLAIADPAPPKPTTAKHHDEDTSLWRVRWANGRVETEALTGAATVDVRTTIAHLTQAMLGCPAVSTLINEGYIEADAAAADALTQLLPARTVYCLDSF